MWTLLEEACMELDLNLAAKQGGNGSDCSSHIAAELRRRSFLHEKQREHQQVVELADQLTTYLTMVSPNPQSTPAISILRREGAAARKTAEEMVYLITISTGLSEVCFLGC